VRLAVPDVFAENSDSLSVGIGKELVASLEKDELELLVYRLARSR
jgi:hypothetical protein